MRTDEEIKQEIITELEGDGELSSYIDGQEYLSENDWEDIADAVQKNLIYDPCGLVYTADGFVNNFKMTTFRKE
jgi:hypothetical protein